MVIWIIGMSASGKTTLGLEMYNLLKASGEKWVFLDGDILRNVFRNSGHTIEERRINAYRISDLCRVLDIQGINVIACVLSIFHDNQDYNRSLFTNYKEVFLEVDFKKLLCRDNKDLYKKAMTGEINNVVGVDIPFMPPKSPDLIISNDSDFPDFNKIALNTLRKLNVPVNIPYLYSESDHHKYPQKYQFTDYLGESFLDSYEKSRKLFLGHLIKQFDYSAHNIPKEGLAAGYALKLLNTEFQNVSNTDNAISVDTKTTLLKLCSDINDGKADESHRNLLFKYVKKFEVSKKLYSSYDVLSWKRNCSDYSDILNYLLLAAGTALYCQHSAGRHERLILFNSLLKVNDLVIASEKKPDTEAAKLLQIASISMELDIFFTIREMAYA